MITAHVGDRVRLSSGVEGVIVDERMGPVDKYVIRIAPHQTKTFHQRSVVKNLGPLQGPPIGATVQTPYGEGKVVGVEPDGRYRVQGVVLMSAHDLNEGIV